MKSHWEHLQALMRERGIGKQQLAEIAGVGPSAVTKWANGGAIRHQHLIALEKHFGASLTHRESEMRVRDAPPPYGTAEHAQPLCRYPADCDLSARLDRMEAQLQTLTQLLGASLRRADEAPATKHERKVG